MTKAKLITLFLAAAIAMPIVASAQTASGTLAVSATVQSSISMAFKTNGSGVALTGAGTNAASLGFGNISAYGTLSVANVSRSVGASSFTVSTPFDVQVDQSNGSSSNYTLKAALASADATNTWALSGTAISTTAATLTATGGYGSASTYTLALTVPFSSTTSSISNTINFVATAN